MFKFFSPRDKILFERTVGYDYGTGAKMVCFNSVNHKIGLNEAVGAFVVGTFKFLLGASIPVVFGVVIVIWGC